VIIPPDQLPIEAYHNGASESPQWLSKTSIRDFQDMGPAWWKMAYIDRIIERPRPDGALQGLALDCYLTEGPEVFASKWAIKPEGMSFATKEGKEWKAQHVGREILAADDYNILCNAIDAVKSHPIFSEIERCAAQQTVRRMSDGLGLGLQSRPDWLDTQRGCLFDLKKCRDLNRFGGQAIDLGYHTQAAIAGWCLAGDGIALEHAYLVAVEWERGARCRVWEIPHSVLEHASAQMRETAADIADRIKTGDWTDHPGAEIEALPIPDFMLRRMDGAA
jgi:hypothetical protein